MMKRMTILGSIAIAAALLTSSESQAQIYVTGYSTPYYGSVYAPGTYYAPAVVRTGFLAPLYRSGISIGIGVGYGSPYSYGYSPYRYGGFGYPLGYNSYYLGNRGWGGGYGYHHGGMQHGGMHHGGMHHGGMHHGHR